MNYSLNVEAKTSQTSPLSSALGGHNRLKSILNGAVVQLALVGLALTCSLTTWGQQSAVVSESVGSRVFMEVSRIGLRSDLDTLYARVANLGQAVGASSSLTWSDVLTNGGNPGMDINFSSYDITGLGGLMSTGTLAADSLTLNKDADITGRLSVTDVVNFNDSLTVTGYVEFSDSLEVVKAVSVGETLYVTGVTSLGDSLHVVGNVDLDALFNVDGAATFGSTMVVTGETSLNDSLHVNSSANITGTLEVDGETTLNDSLHVNSGVNITGDLVLGTTNVNNALADIIPFNHYEAWIQHSSIISGITASTTSAQMFVDSTSTQSVDPESIYGLSGGDVTIQSSGYYEIQGYVFGSRTTAGSGYITASVSVGAANPLPQCTATEEWTLNVNSSARTNCRIQVLAGQTIRLNVVEQAGGTSNITDAGIVLKKVANTLSPG